MRKLAIIGGSGILGRHLIEKCQKFEIVSFDRAPFPAGAARPEKFKALVGDALQKNDLLAACRGADAVWIRSGLRGGLPSIDIAKCPRYLAQNTDVVRQTLSACEATGCRKVFHDSSEQVFGTSADTEVHHPDTEPQSMNYYGASKSIAEKILQAWTYQKPGRSVQIFRTSRVRGTGEHDLLWTMVSACLKGEPIRLNVNASHALSFIHIEDVMDANVKAMRRSPRFAIYHLSSGRPYSIFEIAQRVQAVVGRQVPIQFEENASTTAFEPLVVGMAWEDSARALGVRPRWTLDRMIRQLADAQKGPAHGG